jgi:2-polyprenyl-3-methyl-5-hydroxy-6-metoxy-1,4-benzoquinol methylase
MKPEPEVVKTFEREVCPQCQNIGSLRYKDMSDRLFGAPGTWNIHECNNGQCGSFWLSPLPLEAELYKVYENYYTHAPSGENKLTFFKKLYLGGCRAYHAKFFNYPLSYTRAQSVIANILRFIPRRSAHLDFLAFHLMYKKSGTLLEVGCGSGNHLKSLSGLGWTVHGIDVDEKAVQSCLQSGLPASTQTIEELKDQGKKYDAIVMSHVIEHVHNPEEFIKKCYELLNENGKIVLITPNVQSLSHKIFRKSWLPLDPPRHLTLFNMKSLSKIMKRSGFETSASSSIRFSDGSFVASLSISLTGHAKMNEYGRSLAILAKFYQYMHFLAFLWSKKLGEELVITGTKKLR